MISRIRVEAICWEVWGRASWDTVTTIPDGPGEAGRILPSVLLRYHLWMDTQDETSPGRIYDSNNKMAISEINLQVLTFFWDPPWQAMWAHASKEDTLIN